MKLWKLCLLAVFTLAACKDTEFNITNEGSSSSGSTQVATVSGQIVDSQGLPVSNVTIATLPFGRSITTDAIGRKTYISVTSDAQGFYQISDLPQASYRLNFLASGFIKGSLAIGPIDFVPENLIDGKIQKAVVLQSFPQIGDGDTPAVALFDPEDKKRMTEILVSHGIRFDNIIDNVPQLKRANYNLLVVGLDTTVFQDIEQLIDNANVIDNFLAEGGSVYLGQLNDFSVEATPMPFLTGDQQFVLHTEDAPFNDFISAKVVDNTHPLVEGVSFNGWHFVEAGQQTAKQNVTFDAALKSSIDTTNWHIVVTTPAQDFNSGSGTVTAEFDVIIAEYTDPRSGSRIILNQAAYYQATFGDVTDSNGIRLTNNVVDYIQFLNHGF